MSLLVFRGVLRGHNDWVTCLSTPAEAGKNILASGSRDKCVIIWDVTRPDQAEGLAGFAKMSLKKHSQAVSDVVLSSRGDYVLSASWDKTLRLWDLSNKESFRTFTGHSKEVHSVAFSPDNRQIVSASADRTIKLWNTLGQCKHTVTDGQHGDWISCVRFSPDASKPLVVSGGWDRMTKVWDLKEGNLKCDLIGHTNVVYTVTVSPDGSLCASGGKDGVAMLWDVNEGNHLYSLEAGEPIYALCFSPCNYWLCGATEHSLKIWCLEKKKPLADIRITYDRLSQSATISDKADKKKETILANVSDHPVPGKTLPWCTSLTWSTGGDILYAGSTNGMIYAFNTQAPRVL